MISRKSIQVLTEDDAAGNRWQGCYPLEYRNGKELAEHSSRTGNYKGVIRLVLGVFYFLSLAAALTILLT